MDGGGGRASWAIVLATRLRGAAKARTRDRRRPRDRWNAEGSDHGENKSLRHRRRASREISKSPKRLPAARGNGIPKTGSQSIRKRFQVQGAGAPPTQSIQLAPGAGPVLRAQKLTLAAKVDCRRHLQGEGNGQMWVVARRPSMGGGINAHKTQEAPTVYNTSS